MKRRFAQLFVLAVVVSALPVANSQWASDGPPEWLQTEFSTIGGITYFRVTSSMNGWCERLAQYAVSREGTNLTQTIQQEKWQEICACDTLECGPVPNKQLVSVLGALPPGDYRLVVWSTDLVSRLAPSGVFPFSVPEKSNPTLAISANANASSLQIDLASVAGVQYVLEGSPDLTAWTAVRTNLGAPVSFTQDNNGSQRFYRTKIVPIPAAE
jgi:hypothetical protein